MASIFARDRITAGLHSDPSKMFAAVRTLLRHRNELVRMVAQHVQHMQKALTQMNVHIHHVISDRRRQNRDRLFAHNEGLLGKLPSLTAEQVVKAGLQALDRGRVVKVVGGLTNSCHSLNRRVPRRTVRWVMGVSAQAADSAERRQGLGMNTHGSFDPVWFKRLANLQMGGLTNGLFATF
ncbi:MAG TPA: hypothetical protein VEU11_16870 [Terriglobales bacterium]|nr:hypothetical protein [Terriglobales bacterium]